MFFNILNTPIEQLPDNLTETAFEMQKIAGCEAHNRRIDQKRNEYFAFQLNKKQVKSIKSIEDELRAGNVQAEKAAKASSKYSKISIVVSVFAVVIAIAAFIKSFF